MFSLRTVLALILSFTASVEAGSNNDVPEDAICINQVDFDHGTFMIDTPGNYKLCENIVFSPNHPSQDNPPPEACFDPVFDGYYDENKFGLGYYAAIAIASHDVNLYLNGKRLEQSVAHALFQRFYANIELADSPFIQGAGPAQFVGENSTMSVASNVQILGPGTLGRSSHHGIHGNENSNIVIKDVKFKDFEVAAVALNHVDGLEISDCKILRNRHDVPVLGSFSAARFIRPYGKVLKDIGYTMNLRGVETTAEQAYNALIDSINNVYADVVHGNGFINEVEHPDEYNLFHNPMNAVDGSCYAFLVHGKGPAVGGHGDVFSNDTTTVSRNVVITGNTIKKMKCWVNEVPALVDGEAVINDARGAIFQTVNAVDGSLLSINPDGTYKGNVVADMQMMVAQAILDNTTLTDSPQLQTGVNTITQNLVDWAKSGTATLTPQYRCNGDSMHHVNKGLVMIRVEDTEGFEISNNKVSKVVNLSVPPFPSTKCYDYHTGASEENEGEQQACNIRAISVAADRGFADGTPSIIRDNIIRQIRSPTVDNSDVPHTILGIDVQGDSANITISENIVDLSKKAKKKDLTDPYIALRVRENAEQTIVVGDNKLKQEQEILNYRRQVRSLKKLEGHPGGDVEWKAQGCPFAHMMGKARTGIEL